MAFFALPILTRHCWPEANTATDVVSHICLRGRNLFGGAASDLWHDFHFVSHSIFTFVEGNFIAANVITANGPFSDCAALFGKFFSRFPDRTARCFYVLYKRPTGNSNSPVRGNWVSENLLQFLTKCSSCARLSHSNSSVRRGVLCTKEEVQ